MNQSLLKPIQSRITHQTPKFQIANNPDLKDNQQNYSTNRHIINKNNNNQYK